MSKLDILSSKSYVQILYINTQYLLGNVKSFSIRANKERQKADRVVFQCQERAYWIVQRPPVSLHTDIYSTSKHRTATSVIINQ